MTTTHTATPVSERALIGRINRKLVHEGEALRTVRGAERPDLGRYSVVDVQSKFIVAAHCDLEVLGKELGALKALETLV